MWMICGLGNPGKKYELTRHNVGFLAIDELCEKFDISLNQKKFKGEYGRGQIAQINVILLKPQTFMNLSGESLGPLSGFYKISPDKVIVIQDEIDLPYGTFRIKFGGGAGGHNGIRDIISSQVGEAFIRIRVGVGRPKSKLESEPRVVDFVLGKWGFDEGQKLPGVLEIIQEAIVKIIKEGYLKAQTSINAIDLLKEST